MDENNKEKCVTCLNLQGKRKEKNKNGREKENVRKQRKRETEEYR